MRRKDLGESNNVQNSADNSNGKDIDQIYSLFESKVLNGDGQEIY